MKRGLLVHPEELSRKWIRRMADQGVNVLGLHPVGGRKANESLAALIKLLETQEFRTLLDEAADAGLEIEYELHAARYLMPEKVLMDHPEFCRVDENGYRNLDVNFCASEQKALELAENCAAELAQKLYRSSDRFYFWLDDVQNGKCHCEKCRGLSASDQQMLIMNAMLSGIRKVRPNAQLAYLAYYSAITPPEKVAPAEGIFLEYAPYERDFTKPVRMMPEDELENIRKLLDFFGCDGAKVLEYWYDNSLFSRYKKPPVRLAPDNEMVRADMRYYHSLGFEDIASFACYLGSDYEELYGEPDISGFGVE